MNQPIEPKGLAAVTSQIMEHNRTMSQDDQYAYEPREEKKPRRFFVYRQVGDQKTTLCRCDTADAAQQINRALNFMHRLDGRITEEIPYDDGSIFLVVRGEQAQNAYEAALPYLKDDSIIYEWECPLCNVVLPFQDEAADHLRQEHKAQ